LQTGTQLTETALPWHRTDSQCLCG